MGVTDVSAVPAEAGVPRSVVSPAWIGWAVALAAIMAFSIATPIARAALVGGMDPNALLVSRMVLATLLMGVTIAVSHPERLSIGWRAVGIALGAGLVNAFGMVCYHRPGPPRVVNGRHAHLAQPAGCAEFAGHAARR